MIGVTFTLEKKAAIVVGSHPGGQTI